MDIRMDPKAEQRRAKDDWASRAHKVANAPCDMTLRPGWVVVMVDEDDELKGRASYAREQLARYGVRAETRACRGIPGSRHGNWRGFVTFARLEV